jgi:predicted histidine transporter YuiF (NhaC family)
MGFLLVVNTLVFILGMFIDFFEIAFIVVPLLAPVADKMGIDLIWFGIILALNLQTSFLTPPFGFALFYLRSVAARSDYTDHITKERIPAVTTAQIYKGSIAFIVLQLIMVGVVIAFPSVVTGSVEKAVQVDQATVDNMLNNMPGMDNGDTPEPAPEGEKPATAEDGMPKPPSDAASAENDAAMKALTDSMKK